MYKQIQSAYKRHAPAASAQYAKMMNSEILYIDLLINPKKTKGSLAIEVHICEFLDYVVEF